VTKKITEIFAMDAPFGRDFRGRNPVVKKLAQMLGFFLARASVAMREGRNPMCQWIQRFAK